MKKMIAGAIACLALLISAMPVFATGPGENFGGDSEVWFNDFEGHYVNVNNPENRKDWTNHRFAVPGQGGANADENAAVIEWGDGTLVDPLDTF